MEDRTETSVSVISAPFFDPAQRKALTLDEGLTIAQIVREAVVDASAADQAQLRVTIVTSSGSVAIPREHWHRVKPKAGVSVVIRCIPGKDMLKSILQIVVSIAAVALGQYWVGALGLAGTTGGTLLSAAFGLGVSTIGSLQTDSLAGRDEGGRV